VAQLVLEPGRLQVQLLVTQAVELAQAQQSAEFLVYCAVLVR
jgi:hypothetical protein